MFELYTDGGSRGNPGSSAVAYFIFQDNKLVDFGGEFIKIATNNYAEYMALIKGLSCCIKNHIKTVKCILDSELVVKQLNKIYKVSSPEIKKLNDKVQLLTKEFEEITFHNVLRERNTFSDKLVNIILDSVEK